MPSADSNRIRIRPATWSLATQKDANLKNNLVLAEFVNTLLYLWATDRLTIGEVVAQPHINLKHTGEAPPKSDFDELLEGW